ncbi:MAG: M14 family metallocarboxypeptidase [Cocleimonas sp.]
MKTSNDYPIGTVNQKWNACDKALWLSTQSVKRSYHDEVLVKLELLKQEFDIEEYGALSYEPEKYPLFIAKTRGWMKHKPFVLITGGVHGYETSGVQGALRFLKTAAFEYSEHFNLVIAPCVSPWGYETINRWNPYTIDPNRSFKADGEAEEALLLMKYLNTLEVKFTVHIDLHETTDTDNSEFRPALAARDNIHQPHWDIPDGLYLVGDSEKPVHDFQTAIINGVSEVTHIAPSDENGKIIGVKATQNGVINYEISQLGLATSMTDCTYSTTTEVYPDSPKTNDETCIQAQVAAVCSGLDYVLQQKTTK